VKIQGSEEPGAPRTVGTHTTGSDATAEFRLGGAGPTQRVPSADSDPPFRSVGFTISTIGYAVSRRFHEALAPLQLEPREFALLRAVGVAEGKSQQAIGERLQIPPSRMVAFIDALEARGLIERRHNPEDRRTRALHLTEAGHELLGRAIGRAMEFERSLCAGLSAAEREELLALLQRVGAELGLPPGVHAAHAALAESPPVPESAPVSKDAPVPEGGPVREDAPVAEGGPARESAGATRR
jgi:DNA-binding MarR family transcriptional regulator